MRGRKPLPTELQLQRNNPGRRPLNLQAPKYADLAPAPPAELTAPEALAEWTRVVSQLKAGHITTVDRATLVGYCLKWGQWLALEREAAGQPFVLKAPSGYPVASPALGLANTAFKLLLQAAAELGITPSSRTRIVADLTPAPAVDAFSAHQRQRLTLAKGRRHGPPASR